MLQLQCAALFRNIGHKFRRFVSFVGLYGSIVLALSFFILFVLIKPRQSTHTWFMNMQFTDILKTNAIVTNLFSVAEQFNISCDPRSDINATMTRALNTSENVPGALKIDNECIRAHLKQHLEYCTSSLFPHPDNIVSHRTTTGLCPCISRDLVGRMYPPRYENMTRDIDTSDVQSGGRWYPSHCIARTRLAMIIPFANREHHLKVFLNYMIPFLKRQLLDFQIFVIEQAQPRLFSKTLVMNVGFLEAQKHANFDCYVFHDVDLLPIDDRNFYFCSGIRVQQNISVTREGPKHLAAYIDKWNYRPFYDKMFGGATAFTKDQFEIVNGYSTKFYGWGGEDDDMHQRVIYKKFIRTRPPQCVSMYNSITHERDKRFAPGKYRSEGWEYLPNEYDTRGLRQTNYTLVKTTEEKLFTKISVNLPPPPESLIGNNTVA